jgi:Co/Zn/Cd efflux system component
MYRVALIGLVINTVSGTLLFMANPDAFYESNPFRIKIILLIVGITLMVRMSRRLFSSGASAQSAAAVNQSKLTAMISIIVWVGVIVAGRLIAYVDWKEF